MRSICGGFARAKFTCWSAVLGAAALAVPTSTHAVPLVGRVQVTANGTQATLTVRTPVKATIVVSTGITSATVLYAPTVVGRTLRAGFDGLAPNAMYRYKVTIRRGAQGTVLTGRFATGSRPPSPAGSTRGSAITLDGQPFFPVMTWQQCPQDVDANLAVGINTFLADCGDTAALSRAVAGRGYIAASAATPPATTLPGQIGVYQHDEPESYGPASALPDASNVLSWQTFTDQFALPNAVLPLATSGYQPYIAKARVLGFDLYPLAEHCAAHKSTLPRGLDAVYDDQRALVGIGAGRPTYQWIETNAIELNCGADPVPAQAVTAESWLAVAGGATGIGYFTHLFLDGGANWQHFAVSAANQNAIRRAAAAFGELAPALTTTPRYGFVARRSPLRVGYRILNGAVYVIAANSSAQPVRQSFVVPALADPKGGRAGFTYGEGQRPVHATNDGTITDRYAGYGVHIYIFPQRRSWSLRR